MKITISRTVESPTLQQFEKFLQINGWIKFASVAHTWGKEHPIYGDEHIVSFIGNDLKIIDFNPTHAMYKLCSFYNCDSEDMYNFIMRGELAKKDGTP